MKLSDLDQVPADKPTLKLSDLITGEDEKKSKLVSEMKPTSSAAGAFARGAARQALPAAAGAAAFMPGFEIGMGLGALTGPAAPVVSPVLGIIGGLGSSYLGSRIGTGVRNRFLNMMPDSWRKKIGMDLQQELADEEQHPIASFAGELAPNLIGVRAVRPKMAGALLGAAAGGSIEAGTELAQGKPVDPAKVGIAAVAGMLPTKDTSRAARMESKVKEVAKQKGIEKQIAVTPAGEPTQAERTYGEHLTTLYDDQQNKLMSNKLKELKRLKEDPGLNSAAYQENKEKLYHAWDQGKGGMIGNEAAQKISKQIIQPLQKDVAQLRQKIADYGVDVGEDVKHYIPRMLEGEERGTIFDTFDMTNPANHGKTFSTWSRHFQDRQAVALVGEKGWRTIAVRDPEKNIVQLWHNGKVTSQYSVDAKSWNSGEFVLGKSGQKVKRVQASAEEVESHTPLRYVKDPVASLVDAKYKLANVLQNLEYLEALKHDPRFDRIAAKANEAYHDPAYNGWRKVEGLPKSFDNTVFSPRIAERLEDIINKPSGSTWESVGKISRTITGSMFWNPLPHINNVLWHAVVEKGLLGTLNPLTMPTRMKNTAKAMKAVFTQNEDYHKWLMESGSGMMSQNVFGARFTEQVMKKLGNDPRSAKLAESWGFGTFKNMADRIMNASRTSMWGVNDMILMKAYMDKEASGMTAAQAVASVNKHIPTYRVPPRVLVDNEFGRKMSQALQDPSFIAFGRYEYGRLASYGHMVTDLLGKQSTMQDRAHALDQIAMLAFATFIMYPMVMDPMAKAITGNPNATAVRAGPSTIPFFLSQVYHNDAEMSQLPNRAFVVAPATKSAIEFAFNRDLFTGKREYDDPKSLAQSLVSIFPTGQDIVRIGQGKETVGQMASKAVSISSPTPKQVEARNKAKARRIRDAAKKKGRSGE